MMAFHTDRDDMDRFIRALFAYADQDTFVSLRAFDQHDSKKPPVLIQTHKINGDLRPLVDAATRGAERAANASSPAVFAPPICTFSNADRARTEDLANGLALSVEIDAGDTAYCRKRLESIFGPCTLVMASGSEWSDPLTGEIFPKLHLHWRLSEPTREGSDHTKLRQARDLAAQLVGADPTGKPIVHPLRWAGSWNLKGKPVLAKIIAFNDTSEIHLDEALSAIEEAVEAAGLGEQTLPASNGKPEAPLSLVASAMAAIPNAGIEVHYDHWMRMGYAVYRATGGTGYDIWDEWSKKSDKYNAAEQEAGWGRISRAITSSSVPRPIGAGTIFFHAGKAGWVRPGAEPPPEDPTDPGWFESIERDFEEHQRSAEHAEVGTEVNAEPPELREGTIIDPREWTSPAPLREWLVQDWIPIGAVTGLYADGGVGKSLLMQQLITSTAMGLPWLGLDVRPGFAFGMFCEDDKEELQRRQEAINGSLGVRMQQLELVRYSSRVGFDNLLMTFSERNQGEPTALFSSLVKFLTPHHPRLVVIDTIADTFGGDEIKRVHARQFVQGVGGNLARAFNCAVVMIGHVSMSGMNSGQGTSGSTAWNNTFRSRMYLTKPKDADGNEEDDKRLLSRKKANYAAANADLQLMWGDGCFVTAGRSTDGPSSISWEAIDQIFDEINRAWKDKSPWSVEPQTRKFGRYLPNWMQVTFGISEAAAGRLLGQWQANGYLRTEVYDGRTKRRGLRVLRRMVP